MKRLLWVVPLILAGSAFAQSRIPDDALVPPTSTFRPWQVDERAQRALESALGEIPLKYAYPMFNFLRRKEDEAVIEGHRRASEAPNAGGALADPSVAKDLEHLRNATPSSRTPETPPGK